MFATLFFISIITFIPFLHVTKKMLKSNSIYLDQVNPDYVS